MRKKSGGALGRRRAPSVARRFQNIVHRGDRGVVVARFLVVHLFQNICIHSLGMRNPCWENIWSEIDQEEKKNKRGEITPLRELLWKKIIQKIFSKRRKASEKNVSLPLPLGKIIHKRGYSYLFFWGSTPWVLNSLRHIRHACNHFPVH